MAVDQKRAAETPHDGIELAFDRDVEWPVRLLKPLLEVAWLDRAMPQVSVMLRSPRDNSEASARSGADAPGAAALHDLRIDVVLGAIAVDRGPWSLGNDRSESTLDGSLDEPVDQRVLQQSQ